MKLVLHSLAQRSGRSEDENAPTTQPMALSRELPLGKNAAVLVIDAQNYCWEQGKGIWAGAEAGAPSPYYWEQVEAATANIASILGVLRP